MTWDSPKHIYVRGKRYLLPQESKRSKLIRVAEGNGWRLEPTAGTGLKLRHQDGYTLYVNNDWRGQPNGGNLFPPTGRGREVSDEEVKRILTGLRCECPTLKTSGGSEYVKPLDTCELRHGYARKEAECFERAEAISV